MYRDPNSGNDRVGVRTATGQEADHLRSERFCRLDGREVPVVMTSSMEEYAQGPLISELADIFPAEFAARIKRVGVVNAMDDKNFAATVKATGRRKLIIASVTNEVCTVYPALTLVSQGYDVQVVADAGGSPSKMADDMALRRMEKNRHGLLWVGACRPRQPTRTPQAVNKGSRCRQR